jgi:hypothetical protein
MDIHFGKLIDVLGRAAQANDIRIVAAVVQLEGSMYSGEYALRDHTSHPPPILRTPIANHYEAAWVRARIPRALGFTPEPSETEKSLLDLGFVAVPPEGLAFPFVCSDYYGKTHLYFSQSGPDEDSKRRAAHAFWSILLAEPDELEDFSTRVLHLGAPVVLEFGCDCGEPYCVEHPD